MRVLKSGVIKPGDKARLVKSHPDTMSAATITKVAFENG